MNIGDAARASGIPKKTIRYYEQIGLVGLQARSANGYRVYDGSSVEVLRFIKRARDLGFALDEVRELLALWTDEQREAADVRRLAVQHLETVQRKIAELEELHRTLGRLVESCDGGERPSCPILEDLARDEGVD